MPDLLPELPVEIQVVECLMLKSSELQTTEQRLGLPTYASVVGLSKAGHREVSCSFSSRHSRMGTVHGSFACWVSAQRIQAFIQPFPQLLRLASEGQTWLSSAQDDADFGGAISTALDCNDCIRDTAKELKLGQAVFPPC